MVYYHCHCLSAFLTVCCFLFALFRIAWPSFHWKELGDLTPSRLKVTVRQFSEYRKIKCIYVQTMLLFKVIGGMSIILNSYGRK